MSNIVVDVHQVSKSFGSEQVLKNVSLQLEQGKIHGIIGRNGSGKTLLMKCICGFLRPTSGTVTVWGKTVGTDCDFAPDTGMLIETPGFLPHETGLHNLLWLTRLGKGESKARVMSLLERVGLDSSLRKPVSQYSLGMRQRLGIAQALLDDPALLILDEPMNGLDKSGVRSIRELLLSLSAQGKTILLASHFAQDMDELCNTVCEMDQGVLTMVRDGHAKACDIRERGVSASLPFQTD